MKIICIFLSGLLIAYLCVAFCNLSIDIYSWSYDDRVVVIIAGMFIGLITNGFNFIVEMLK